MGDEQQDQTVKEGQPQITVEPEPETLQLFEAPPEVDVIAGLVDRYLIPPFTILDRRAGYWQKRGKQWKGLGIESELGRGMMESSTGRASGKANSSAMAKASGADINRYKNRKKAEMGGTGFVHGGQNAVVQSIGGASRRAAEERSNLTGAPELPEWADNGTANIVPGTSIFDPVICEIVYRWFAPPDGLVLDPFAGGSVRGIIAAATGRRYEGIDLSGPQVEANRAQAERILPDRELPRWIVGDSAEVLRQSAEVEPADLIFTCPPYGNLEVYSDDPNDLSTMSAAEFAVVYTEIIAAAVARLKDDRFGVFVVGNYRDKKGMLHDLAGLTTRAFTAAGARLYNDAVILDPVGTAPVRAPRQFSAARKLVRVHQQLLVYVKGDPAKATDLIRDEREREPSAEDRPLDTARDAGLAGMAEYRGNSARWGDGEQRQEKRSRLIPNVAKDQPSAQSPVRQEKDYQGGFGDLIDGGYRGGPVRGAREQ